MRLRGDVQVPAERVLFLAVGVPEENAEVYGYAAISALNDKGFAVKTMELEDITAQADHIRQTLDQIKEQTHG